MKRVRCRNLVLVNWKGVFYDRYALDDNVTALEGDNGAGKTTVMIGAYVVLLPDMTRLRFTNVGETDATGGDKGVWGRLGNPNRPSYAVMVFDVDEGQVIAGVHLERKGEPSVELTPFLISDLPADVRLQDALLLRSGDQELVPEFDDLRENVARLGGRVQICRTAKEYFSALFERGITPLRLTTDEERTRFNDMLRTSMTGGISRALTSEFRSFLLKEESGLADTLVRMRSNLDACRRTRREVGEAQALEREISDVYEAGHAMFAAALLATRERAEELSRRVEEARQKRDTARRERDTVAHDLEERQEERSRAGERLGKARKELEVARKQHERTAAANIIANRVAELDENLLKTEGDVKSAALALKHAEEKKDRCAVARARAEDSYRRAAEGLADLQRGLDEFHRRADAHRMVTRRLGDANALLERQSLTAEQIPVEVDATTTAIADLDKRRNEVDARISGADAHASEHDKAMRALKDILERDGDLRRAHEEARAALAKLSELDGLASRAEALGAELGKARQLLARQRAVLALVQQVAQPDESLTSSLEIRQAFSKAEDSTREAEEQRRQQDIHIVEQERIQTALKASEKQLHIRSVRWRELDAVASRLERTLGAGLRSAPELEAARQVLDDERDKLQRRRESLEIDRDQAKERARILEESGGVFHSDLLTARDFVGGELLAGHFDDLNPVEAAQVQARLGPLAEAIVVDNAREAAMTLAGRERVLETIWLVGQGGLHDLIAPGDSNGIESRLADVIVERDGLVRTTRIPASPTLGKKARERLIADLRTLAQKQQQEIDVTGDQLGDIASRRRDTALLTRDAATLELGDPSRELMQLALDLTRAQTQLEERRLAAAGSGRNAFQLAQRLGKLRDLLADAFVLDEPDLEQNVLELDNAVASAGRARLEIGRVSGPRQTLTDLIEVLRRPPLSAAERETMQTEVLTLHGQRERLFLALDALRYVADNREAIEWSDAEEALTSRQELIPALKTQCDNAEVEKQSAIATATGAENAWEAARIAWREIDNRRSALEERRVQAQRDLEVIGVADPSDAAVAATAAESARLADLVQSLDQLDRKLGEALAQLRERLDGKETTLEKAEEQFASVEKEWKPAADLWERLRARADENGLLTPAITTKLLEAPDGSSVKLRTEARTKAAQLEERLRVAQGGGEILERIRAWVSGQEQTTGDDFLQAWEVVRDWLRRRVPAQVAEVDDPLEALERLRHHLKALGDRLDEQEQKLRGTSEDVARGIDVHIRAAQRQVRTLNLELDGVRFGTIRNMRIRLSRDERMERILKALRESSAQDLLFAPTMPVEEALEALFAQHGGRGPSTGHKLLDYREYVDIAVEVQRKTNPQWERVNPSRLSTGEAIGVGTALMMVVLTAWERAANIFRARRSLGTLRLLFLDEANRLSQDNLEVLFELCVTLDLQLLIAAPEVARARGCTTYRLVRRDTADGGEDVVVSGRRAKAEA